MDINVHLKFLFLNLLTIQGAYQLSCTAPKSNRCIPIGRPPLTCITKYEDGLGATWFDMEDNCKKDNGRLVWLKDDFSSVNLVVTENSLSRTNVTNFIVIGLLRSIKGDDFTFWKNPNGSKTMTCGRKDTSMCLSPAASQKHCYTIGCCWVNGKCQYPEYQRLAENNGSSATVTGSVTERSCVGLQKNGVNWNLTTYDCSMPAVSGTSYVCEYKCDKDWPDVPKRNVTWIRTTFTGIPGSPTTTIKSGNGRNGAGNFFEKQVVLMTYIALVFLLDSVELFIL